MMDRTAWEVAVSSYKRAAIIRDASAAFGPMHKAEGENIFNDFAIKMKHGSRAAATKGSKARAAYDAEDQRHQEVMDAYYDRYNDPAREAAQAIVKIPAPDLDALRFKVDLIKDEELHAYVGTENAFDYVEADAKRLAA